MDAAACDVAVHGGRRWLNRHIGPYPYSRFLSCQTRAGIPARRGPPSRPKAPKAGPARPAGAAAGVCRAARRDQADSEPAAVTVAAAALRLCQLRCQTAATVTDSEQWPGHESVRSHGLSAGPGRRLTGPGCRGGTQQG